MDESTSLDLRSLDLSIVFTDLGPEGDVRPASGFWHSCLVDTGTTVTSRRPFSCYHLDSPISRDYVPFVDAIADRHKPEFSSSAEPTYVERPYQVDDQVTQCTPQFILRNIPKIERYNDLSRRLPFSFEDLPITEVNDIIREARETRIDEVEFPDHDMLAYLNDFRSFLEEIFYLCPWEMITKRAPTEDNPWHIRNSVSQLARDMLANKDRFFIYSDKGVTTRYMDSEPPKPKASAASSMPSLPSGFGASFGPR